MLHESLPRLRGFRQLKSGLDLTRRREPKTRHSLTRLEENTPVRVNRLSLARRMRRARDFFARLQASVTGFQERMLRQREKLKALKEENRRLAQYRLRGQREEQNGSKNAREKPGPALSGAALNQPQGGATRRWIWIK